MVIDLKVSDDRPIPVEHLRLDQKLYSEEEINKFKERYEAQELIPFSQFLEQEGLDSQVHKRRSKSKQDDSIVNTEEQI